MEDLILDNFDFSVMASLYPNFTKNLPGIKNDISKYILKKVSGIDRFDLRSYMNYSRNKLVSEGDLIEFAFLIFYDITLLSLRETIINRVETSLKKLTLFDDEYEHLELTNYGKNIFRKLRLEPKGRNQYLKIKFGRITDLSRFKSKLIVVKKLEPGPEKLILLHLRQSDLRLGNIDPWTLVDNPFFVKAAVDELNIVQEIIKLSLEPLNPLPAEQFQILDYSEPSIDKARYLLRKLDSQSPVNCSSYLLDRFIPLTPAYWNYNDGEYILLRSGLTLRLTGTQYSFNSIQGFDELEISDSLPVYLETTILNLFDQDKTLKDKDSIALLSTDKRVIVISWDDLEANLDLSRKNLLKKRNKLKRQGEAVFHIMVEGNIRKHEIKLLENTDFLIYLYLEESIISFC